MTNYKDQKNSLEDNLQNLIKSPADLQPPQSPTNPPDVLDNPGCLASSEDYRFEAARLQSFSNWPVRFIDPATLATAGFYYSDKGDYVKCFECGVEIGRWVEDDNPMSEHQRWQSNCRFVRKQPCGNVPIGVDPSTVPFPVPRSRDICGQYGEEIRPGSSPDFRAGHQAENLQLHLPSTTKLGSLGLAAQKGPVHPEYASYDARLKTFDAWPKFMIQTKERLADAGFYYTGTGDQTLCYHCGGGLKDWEPDDDPWVQHAKWFKKCCYVLMVKGQAFINNVIGQPVDPPTREETMQMNLPSFIKKVQPATSAQADDKQKQETPIVKPVTCKPSDDARMCKICYNEELGVVFLPCGHMVACTKCAPGMASCAVCREPVSMTVRAIIS